MSEGGKVVGGGGDGRAWMGLVGRGRGRNWGRNWGRNLGRNLDMGRGWDADAEGERAWKTKDVWNVWNV